MKRFLQIAFLIFFISSISFAQEVFVCDSYTEDGIPVEASNHFEVKPYGTAKYILYKSDKVIEDSHMFIFLDKVQSDGVVPFDSKTIQIEKKQKWVVAGYEFKEPGVYDLSVISEDKRKLTHIRVEVFYENELNEEGTGSKYITDSQMSFCEIVINEKPINRLQSLSLSKGGKVYVYIDNYVNFGTDEIKVKIWKSEDGSYEKLLDEKKYSIIPTWKDTFFDYTFNAPGEYKIDVFDKTDMHIASNILTVTQ